MSEIDRRSLIKMTGIGLLAAAVPIPAARAEKYGGGELTGALLNAEPRGRPLFADDFDGPAGALPDCVKWATEPGRDQIRDGRRSVFLDGNSNLVIRGTRQGDKYVGGKLFSNWHGAATTTWEARVRLEPLSAACWPANGLRNAGRADSDRLMAGWHGNVELMHSGRNAALSNAYPMEVDDQWHTWRCQVGEKSRYFWADYIQGAPPSFAVPVRSIPHARVLPGLSLTAPSGGGVCPAQMLVDWVRVW